MEDSCRLLGPVSLTIQTLMGILVLLVLLLKRNVESPRRKLFVWIYDITKQIGGSMAIHMINIMISVWKRKSSDGFIRFLLMQDNDDSDNDQCDWYFVNLLMDTTVGIPLLWIILKWLEKMAHYLKISNVNSGNYYNEFSHHPMFSAFLKQFIVFLLGLIIMKISIFIILNNWENVAYWFANLILGWSDYWPNLQIFLIMFVAPLILNILQYYCIDNIIKLHNIDVNNLDNFEATDECVLTISNNSFNTIEAGNNSEINNSVNTSDSDYTNMKKNNTNFKNSNYGSIV